MTPQIDSEAASSLPSAASENVEDTERKPLQRKLPELQYWSRMTAATVAAALLSCTERTNVPVHWPILVVYFCVAAIILFRRLYRHMRRHGYNPLNLGQKKAYAALNQRNFAHSHS